MQVYKTVCAISNFFLTMVLYPNIQKKAQQEIDYIIGTRRLPTLADRAHLPYLNALCLEIYRWNPSAPLGTSPLQTLPPFNSSYNLLQVCHAALHQMISIWVISCRRDLWSLLTSGASDSNLLGTRSFIRVSSAGRYYATQMFTQNH